ncbi:LysR family transcriptional regulator [Enterobacteriaceae bacterium RIT691]|nr:LysR family transcriptional regulator [Enterobacteriaceae bacterium RIT691]
MKLTPALDLEALRSFVTGIESASFAQAAQRLARSTSAVSAQLKKLEHQCGAPLVEKKGRHLHLTPQGELLLGYGKRLLALNDETVRAVKGEGLTGEVRLGMQEDFGESLMPGILGKFSRHHPELRMSARVDRNLPLAAALADNSLDMALMWQSLTSTREGRLLGECPLNWLCDPTLDVQALLSANTPLPLVMFDAPCLMRSQATESLDRAGIPWRIVFTSHSLAGIWAAVQAGLGLTVRTVFGQPQTVQNADALLPTAGKMGIVLTRNAAACGTTAALDRLEALMEDALQPFISK